MKKETTSARWYKKNSEAYNQKRRERYANNPELRAKARMKQAELRRTKPRVTTDENPIMKVIKGVEVRVYRIGDVAEYINRTEQGIRLWENKGLIPKPSVPGGHRYYTLHQMKLLRSLAEEVDRVRYDVRARKEAIALKSAEVFNSWTKEN